MYRYRNNTLNAAQSKCLYNRHAITLEGICGFRLARLKSSTVLMSLIHDSRQQRRSCLAQSSSSSSCLFFKGHRAVKWAHRPLWASEPRLKCRTILDWACRSTRWRLVWLFRSWGRPAEVLSSYSAHLTSVDRIIPRSTSVGEPSGRGTMASGESCCLRERLACRHSLL
jgi:hypothetical protein